MKRSKLVVIASDLCCHKRAAAVFLLLKAVKSLLMGVVMSTKMRLVFCLGVFAGLALVAGLVLATWAVSSDVTASSQPVNTSAMNVGSSPVIPPSTNTLTQKVLSGDWRGKLENNDSKINLNFERYAVGDGRHLMG